MPWLFHALTIYICVSRAVSNELFYGGAKTEGEIEGEIEDRDRDEGERDERNVQWLAVVTVPWLRFCWRTDQNCWNVEVPSIEGAL